jgi:hypothetical protein
MTNDQILQENINYYLSRMNANQKKEVLQVVKIMAIGEEYSDERTYQNEMSKRMNEMENGTVNKISIADLETSAQNILMKHQKIR